MAYGTDEGLIEYLSASGRCLSGSTTAAVVRFWGSAYVDQFEQDYRGAAITTDASFPRDLWTTVPSRVEQAAYEAGLAWSQGVVLFGSGGTSGGQVTSEAVDSLKVTYAEPQDGTGYWENNRYILPIAYALLLPFMKHKGGFYPSALVV